jgi:hypothetical protein
MQHIGSSQWRQLGSLDHHIGGNLDQWIITLEATWIIGSSHWRQLGLLDHHIGGNLDYWIITLEATWIIKLEATWIIGSSHWRQHGDGKLEGKNNKTDTKN